MKKDVATKYARDMANGSWEYTWDCIAFDKEGNLLNGQHRMLALVLSGCTLDMLTLYDAEKITGDIGQKRSAAEEIRGRGGDVSNFVNTSFGTGVARHIYKYYLGIWNATSSEVEDLIKMPKWEKCEQIGMAIKSHSKRGISTSIVATALIGAYIITENESVFKFIDILKSGMADGKNSAPVIALRDYLTSTRTIDNGRKGINDLTYTQAAFRAYINGNVAKRLYRCNGIIYKPTLEMFMNEE